MVDQSQEWDRIAAHWAATRKSEKGDFFRLRAKVAFALAARHVSTGNVLDYGMGDAYLLTLFSDTSCALYGCDISQNMVEVAKERLEFAHTSFPSLAKCEAGHIPFEVKFDLIFALGVFPYIERYDDFAKLVSHRLNNGGYLIANCTNRASLFVSYAILRNLFNFRPSNLKAWLGTFVSLAKTGLWSGGAYRIKAKNNLKQCYSSSQFDLTLQRCGYIKVDEADLFRCKFLDAEPLTRPAISRWFARKFGWNHIGVYKWIS